MNHSALSKHVDTSKVQKLDLIESNRQMPQSQLWFINNRASQAATSMDSRKKNHLNGSILPSVKVNPGKTSQDFNTGAAANR